MYKSVSFNIYHLRLEGIVYKDRKAEKSSRDDQKDIFKSMAKDDMPIPKPIDKFWEKPLEYKKSGN